MYIKKFLIRFYGIAGLLILVLAEILLFSDNKFALIWMTPLSWTGYILLVDFIIFSIKGNSLISRSFLNFIFLCILSVLTWYIFEFYNLFFKNWEYINLPENIVVRYLGYFWSYATIFPAIFETIELLQSIFKIETDIEEKKLNRKTITVFIFTGTVCLILPFIFQSNYMSPFVWAGFILFLDPVNQMLGKKSIFGQIFNKNFRFTITILFAGLICGLLWEFWNFWSSTKWIYNVPYLPEIKLFEMPVLGYLGFPPFALECYIMYTFEIKILNMAGIKIKNILDY